MGTIETILSALFLIRKMYLTGKPRSPSKRISSIFFVNWCYLLHVRPSLATAVLNFL